MPNSHTGHFVSIWRPVGDAFIGQYVEVAGRTISTHINQAWSDRYDGWTGMSRELSFRDAKRFAREYSRAGFKVRVVYRGQGNSRVVFELNAHRKALK